jgi:hypothetical protein
MISGIWSNRLRAFVAACLLISVPYAQSQQGGPAKLSHKAEKLRTKIAAVKPNAPLTVVVQDGSVYLGTFDSAGSISFAIHERNLGQRIEIQYEQVTKLKNGYPDSPSTVGQTRRHRALIALIVVGCLLGLVIGLAASDRS